MGKKKQNRKKDHKKDFFELCFNTAYLVFECLAGVLLPLYYHDAYYDMMQSKESCFSFILVASLPFLIMAFIMKLIAKKRIITGAFDLSLLLFLIVSLVSSLLSPSLKDSFSGRQGWYVGFKAIAFLIFVYFTLKEEKIDNRYIFLPVILVSVFEFIMIVSDCMGLDLLRMRTDIKYNHYYVYFGTIGQSNWMVGYLSLFVTYYVCKYLSAEKKEEAYVYLLVSLLGLLSCILVGADGIYLAFGFCSFFVIPFLFDDLRRLGKSGLLLFLLGIGLFLLPVSGLFEKRLEVMSGIGRILFRRESALLFLLIGLFLYVLTGKADGRYYDTYKRKIIILIEAILGCISLYMIVSVLKDMDPNFGNGRMMLWKYSIDRFRRTYDLKKMLFGIGPELLNRVYAPLSLKQNAAYDSAHSEALHMLMSMGVSGLLAWTACWSNLFVSFFQRKMYLDAEKIALYAGVFAYFGQTFVNSATLPNLCILLLFVLKISEK